LKHKIIRLFLRRKLFKGQFKLFLWLYENKFLKDIKTIAEPIIGDFQINLDTGNFIDACVYYTGDYECYLKKHFAKLIKQGMTVLDVGANIGFHSLYFAELTGKSGKVISFEPIDINYKALSNNLLLNNFPQIIPVNKALSNANAQIHVHINSEEKNPGAYNLLDDGIKNTVIDCVKGDDFLKEINITHVDFIKVDVEGFELKVLKGLAETIQTCKPIIVFEYDIHNQLKLNNNPKTIIYLLAEFGYHFFTINGYGKQIPLNINEEVSSSEVLAIPTKP
jgi:FkbM family methyltransferase